MSADPEASALDAILASWERVLPAPNAIRRTSRLWLKEGSADAIIGPRAAGKSWRMLQHMGTLLDDGVPRSHILHLDLSETRIQRAGEGALEALLERWEATSAPSTGGWLMLDEVHEAADWERTIRRVLSQRRHRVLVSGSSADLLAREIHTSLRGRSLATVQLPYDLAEYLDAHSISVNDALEDADHLHRYLSMGGFPEVQGLRGHEQVMLLQERASTMMLRDVVERHSIRDAGAVRALLGWLLGSTARLSSLARLRDRLAGAQHTVSRSSLATWISHLEDAFVILRLPFDAAKPSERTRRPHKVHAIDPGLARAHQLDPAGDVGHRLETAVATHLWRHGLPLTWGLTHSGRELDLIVQHPDGEREAIQVAWSIAEPDTRSRELEALHEALERGQVDRGTLVTATPRADWEHDPDERVGKRPLRTIHASRYLIEHSGAAGRLPPA